MVAVLGYRLFFIEEVFKVSFVEVELDYIESRYKKLVPMVRGAWKYGFTCPFLFVTRIEVMDMRQKDKKIGYSCYDKKMSGFENPKEKFKRWRRNMKFAYQRIK